MLQGMNVVVVDSRIIELFTRFDIEREIFDQAGIAFTVENASSPEEYVQACKDADALLLIGFSTTRWILDRLPRLKAIIRYGVGYDAVDVGACSEKGIVVANVPDAGIYEVASHTFALMLNLMRKVGYYDRQLRRGNWHPGEGYQLHRFCKYTVGFCGFGNIARIAAQYAANMGWHMIACDPFVKEEVFEEYHVERVDFDTLLKTSDLISIHTPLNDNTRHMFSNEVFSRMKPGMLLVNTSRGGVIDQEALMNAIDKGLVAGAGLDVLETEPLKDTSDRLYSYDTVIVTPHSATESEEYFITLQEKAALTAVAILNGELPSNVINRDAIARCRTKK